MNKMIDASEKEALGALADMNQNKAAWRETIPDAAVLLSHPSDKVKAKALWVLGEMGLKYPELASPYVDTISIFLSSQTAQLRERALNALGRIGRGDSNLIKPYLVNMRLLAADAEPAVRLAFIWACENIATNAPELFCGDLPLFAALLDDENERVRMEAPEIFRVLGKRAPQMVLPHKDRLISLSESDSNRVVRIHAAGAVRAMDAALLKSSD